MAHLQKIFHWVCVMFVFQFEKSWEDYILSMSKYTTTMCFYFIPVYLILLHAITQLHKLYQGIFILVWSCHAELTSTESI